MLELISKMPIILGNTLGLLILSFSIAASLWFITLPLCGLCLYCQSLRKRISNRIHPPSLAEQRILKLLYAAPFAITLVIAGLGGNYQRDPSISSDYGWVTNLTNAISILLYTNLLTCIVVVGKSEQRRAFAISYCLLQLWISWCTAFVSGMFITGQFL